MNAQEFSLGWGLHWIKAPALAAWGARAIYAIRTNTVMKRHRGKAYRDYKTTYDVDLLHDRQDVQVAEGYAEADKKAFFEWLNKTALPWLRKELQARGVGTNSSEILEYRDGCRRIVATPNGSYGYLYIRAEELPEGAMETLELAKGAA